MAFKKKAIAKEVQQNFKLLEDLRSIYSAGGGIQKYDEIGFGRGLNESLRGLNADSKPLSDFDNYFSYHRAKALQSDLMTAKTNPQITYRGLSSGSLMPEKLAQSIGLNPDRPFFDRSFMATTPNRSYASSYGTDVYLSVLGASGYRMPTRGDWSGGEVLYPAGNLFDVENYRKRGFAVTATLVDRNLTPKQIKSLKTNILNEYSDIDRSFQESSNVEPSRYTSNLFEYGQKFQDKKTGDIKSLDLVKGDTATLRSIDGALEVLSVNELKNRYEIKAPTDMKSFNQGDGVISNPSDLRYTVLGDDGDYVRLLGLDDNVREINRAQLKKEYRSNTLGFATYPALTSGLLGTAGIVGGATAGKLLAKSLGANEDQQNVAAGIGGAIGGLTGVTTGYIGDGVTMPKSFRDMAKRAMGVKSNSEAGMVAPNKGGDQILDSLNPTGGIFAGYSPEARVKAKLAKNIKTLAETMRVNPDDLITVYRGSAFQDSINDGDFVTTNKQLAKDYAGGGKVLSQTVRYGDILDDINEPLGDEYILRKGAYEQINPRSADKKINTGSVSSSVKEPKMPKLTTDTLYKYLQMMGGEPVIVKPDGSQATKGKFAFGQDVGLNNEFTKLPEIHTRFDDPKIASMVAKELATGELTIGMQRNPETGEIETVTKKFQPIPSRGNTQLRRYSLSNDPSGAYIAFNKPEEAYKAPKSLKELQADTRKAYQSFGLKPNATIAELQAAVQPIVNEVRASQDLRDRLATVLVDMKNRPELEPVPLERGWDKVQSRSPMTEQIDDRSRPSSISSIGGTVADDDRNFAAMRKAQQQEYVALNRNPSSPRQAPFTPDSSLIASVSSGNQKAIEQRLENRKLALDSINKPSKTKLALESDRIGGYQPKHIPKILEALKDEDFYLSVLGSMSLADQDRFGGGWELLEESGDKSGTRDFLSALNRARRNVPRLGGDMYDEGARQAFSRLDDSLGVKFGFNKTLKFGLKDFANSSEKSYRVDIPDQAKIELSQIKVDGKYAFRVDNIVAYNPEALGDRFAMKTLKFLQENLPKPVVMGNVINEKFARIFEKQGYVRQGNDFLPPELAPQKQVIASEPQPRLNPATDTGGWANAQGESLVTLENVDQKRMQVAAERSAYANQKAPFASQRLTEVDRYGVGAPLDDEAAYNLAKRKFETIKRSALEFPDTFQGVDQSAKFPSFSNLKRQALSEGIMLADSGTNAFKAYADAKAAELTGTLKIPESGLPVTARLGQEYISPKTGAVGTVSAVGKTGVKMVDVNGQPIRIEGSPRPEVIPYQTLERLKYTGNKGYGITANTAMDLPLKFAKGFAMREGARLLAKQLGANEDQQQAVADTVTAANVLGSVYQNVAKKSDIFSQADRANILNNKLPQYDVKPVLSDAAVLATDLLTPHPYGIATVPAARMATDSWKNNYDAIAERGLAAMKTTATGATGAIKDFTYQTLSQLGRSVGLPFPMTEQAVGQVLDAIPNAEQVMSMAKKYTGKKGYGFARIPALAAVTTSGLGVAGGYGAGRALAKALGMDEDQQNLAGVIGGVTGGLTGAIAPASLDYKLAGIAQPVFRVRDMRLPTPQEVGKAFFMPERNPELGMFRMDAIAPSEGQRSQSPALSQPTGDRPQTLSELQRQPDRPQTKGFSNPQSELAIARRELDAKYPYSPPYDRTAKPEPRKLVPFLTFDQAVDQMSMSPLEYRAFQDRVYAEQKTVKSKQYKERQSQIAKQKFQQVQSYSDALKAWNKAGDPTIPMPRKEDFVSPIKNTFDFKQTLSEASMAARSAESRVKGFSKPQPKSAIAQATQAIKNAGEIVFDALYQPSAANPSRASLPKQSTFIAESEVQKAAAATGVSEARVKAEIANQRASGESPSLSKATEAIAFKSSSSAPLSMTERLTLMSDSQSAKPQVATNPRNTVIKSAPSTDLDRAIANIEQSIPSTRYLKAKDTFSASNSVARTPDLNGAIARIDSSIPNLNSIGQSRDATGLDRAIANIEAKNPRDTFDGRSLRDMQSAAMKQQNRFNLVDRIGASGLGVFMDTAQAANVLTESVRRGENAPTALTRAGVSVGAGYAATGLASFISNPYLRTAAQLGGGIAAVIGADKAIDQIVGRNEAKEQKYAKDLSKLDLQPTDDKEQWKPFANDSNIAAAYGNSLTAQIQQNLDYRPAARSLANLANRDAIENARYQSERQTSLQTGMDAKSGKKTIAYESRDDGTEVGYLRNRGYNATESRVLALQNLANESGYETPRTGKFDAKTLDALEKLGYSQSQISAYIKGKTKAIGKPNQVTPDKVNAVKIALARSRGEQVSSSQLSAALSAERKAQGLKGGEMLNQGQVDNVFKSLAGRSLTQLRQSAKVGGNKTQSALRLGAGIR